MKQYLIDFSGRDRDIIQTDEGKIILNDELTSEDREAFCVNCEYYRYDFICSNEESPCHNKQMMYTDSCSKFKKD